MSRPVVVTIPHNLGKQEASRRLKGGLASASSSLPMLKFDEETWVDDRMTFRISGLGQEAAGTVDVGDRDVRVEITLPWLLQRFAEMVQDTIKSRAQILLEPKR